MPSLYSQHIDEQRLKAMTYKILKAEQDNQRTGLKNNKDMVEEIFSIIKAETDMRIKEKK